uniref:E3 ubiquitin-protein ligase TRIM71-like n=1 Tax=Crassostrea virginica TaxID=6565 RepID=A0A8B8AJN3_CRAVI|nr:E3 ubiquitin-protein ligase TRIM71-like [Crassostrea virginica]XP_022290778.1 E3 ubiquitin-protein ligase TRIM71-like [Crassostrea virginica]XP_022290779.1 E3 ubiquitin-protein ligase TRIM71-like [Crassostrea virginica]
MVDFQSRYRLYGHGYTSPELKYPVPSYRELYHSKAPTIFSRRPKMHDCRQDAMKDYVDSREWETWLLSQGLRETIRSATSLNLKVKETYSDGTKKPERLLFNIGVRGSGDGDFNFPRSVITTRDGDVVVADTMNHRIQIFNSFGVFLTKFGKRGIGKLQFSEPTDVAEIPNNDLAVADKRNKRVQIVTQGGQFRSMFETVDEPYSIASDLSGHVIVSTSRRTIEVYKKGGKLIHRFVIPGVSRDTFGCKICVNNRQEVIVCDAVNATIKFFTYEGRYVSKFSPRSYSEGLSIIPSGITINRMGEILVADSLNHTVNVYNDHGDLLKQAICPTDQAGCIQACAVGPEGHLVTTEFSLSGPHTLKIFRYRPCHCHITRPGSSKRRTPTPQTFR